MRTTRSINQGLSIGLCLTVVMPILAWAYDVTDSLAIEPTLTGVYQYGDFDEDDEGRGTVVLDLGANFHPTDADEFQITVSFAAGNALNDVAPFSLAPFADDLEDDLQDINGRNRDDLLEAWYKHTFTFTGDAALGVTAGIIDSTGYIDDNNFANDEVSQFMNDIFVNNTLANLPSYDVGGVVEFDLSNVSVRGLVMNTKNDVGENFNYFAAQFGYRLDSGWGEGNYRVFGFATTEEFPSATGTDEEGLLGVGFSADQELGDIVDAFARLGWQDDEAEVDHEGLISAGVNINGGVWGREQDEIGLGYSYLEGGSADIDKTQVLEAYAKFQVTEFSDLSFDIQYLDEQMKAGEDQDGLIYGVRLNAYF